jgi:hypothetical protein
MAQNKWRLFDFQKSPKNSRFGINWKNEMPKITEMRLVEEFQDRVSFTREDLLEFYRQFEPELNEGTFAWRIHDLIQKNVVRSVKRGVYVISSKPKYKPEISAELTKLSKWINEYFQGAKHCIWDSSWLNEFSQHQSSTQMTFVEIEKDLMESVFYALKDSFRRAVYLNPNESTIQYYVAESTKPIIIKPLKSRSPVDKRIKDKREVYTPSLEKILVDLFADQQLFYYLQGFELTHVYENAINYYAVNFTKLFRYAKRRNREDEIKQFMRNNMYHLVKEVIE